jgi:phosphatidylglycerophosphatase C
MPLSPPTHIAVFDLDRTITRAGTYTPFLLSCMPFGLSTLGRVAAALGYGAAYKAKRFDRAGMKSRMLRLSIAGAPRAQVDAWAGAFVARWMTTHVRPGAVDAIARHRAAGDHLVLATASFDFYADVFARHLGFDHVIATASAWDAQGALRAAVDGENCYGAAKLARVQMYLSDHPDAQITAYSDHHTDFGLLSAAHEGVAVNPNAKLRRLAQAHNMPIVDWN